MIKPLLFTLSTLGFIYYIIKYLSSSIKKIDTVWLQASLAVAIATLIDITVKLYIHRYWFNTWVNNNPSLDVNHAYGFNFFYDASHEIASFPSGHTALTTSFLIVFWIAYPKSRILCALLILAVGLGLILADFHYVGDVIAGGFMGAYIGIFSSLLSKKLRLL
ncbi:MAG: phosphatase PAP2 family protein [Chlamydiales bacterium]|nr:phosphatase PAP2 family protein [Chlamydiales bacterium]